MPGQLSSEVVQLPYLVELLVAQLIVLLVQVGDDGEILLNWFWLLEVGDDFLELGQLFLQGSLLVEHLLEICGILVVQGVLVHLVGHVEASHCSLRLALVDEVEVGAGVSHHLANVISGSLHALQELLVGPAVDLVGEGRNVMVAVVAADLAGNEIMLLVGVSSLIALASLPVSHGTTILISAKGPVKLVVALENAVLLVGILVLVSRGCYLVSLGLGRALSLLAGSWGLLGTVLLILILGVLILHRALILLPIVVATCKTVATLETTTA